MGMESFRQARDPKEGQVSPAEAAILEKIKTPETLDLPEGSLEVVDISPEQLKSPTPTLLVPGYAGMPETRQANVLEIVKDGRRALVIKPTREFDYKSIEGMNEMTEGLPQELESIVRQAAATKAVLDAKGIDKVDGIGESQGGLVVLLAARLYPERFKNILLVDSAGLTEAMPILRLITRFAQVGIKEGGEFNKRVKRGEVSDLAKEQVAKGTPELAHWVAANPKASVKEIQDMARAELVSILKDIKTHDVGISIIHGADDPLFRMSEVRESLKQEIRRVREAAGHDPEERRGNLEDVEKVVDGFYSVAGGHGKFNTDPERYTPATLAALAALEHKAQMREGESQSDS